MKTDFDKLLLDESPDAIITTSPDGNVTYWSKGAQAMFGYTSADTVGRSIEELILPPDRLAEERRILKEALESGYSTYESIRRRKDGSLLYVDISSKSIRDGKGMLNWFFPSRRTSPT